MSPQTPTQDMYSWRNNVILIKKIKTKNDALLNMKHEENVVRLHCELILKGETTWEDLHPFYSHSTKKT
jgi:hypothetical protein